MQVRVDDAAEDAALLDYALAAQGWVETFTGRYLTPRVVVAVAYDFGLWRLLGDPLEVTGISCTTAEGAPLNITSWHVCRRRGWHHVWVEAPPAIRAQSAIELELTAGFADGECPFELVQACKMLVGHWFRQREAVTVGTFGAVDYGVQALCERWRMISGVR